jgi:predicted outer membrane repeat protein
MTNVTVARNAAFRGGGIYGQNNAVISVLNSTVYTNTASSAGGGIWNNTAGAAANVILKNTIVAANNDPVSGVLNCDGPAMRTLGHNLIGDGTCITPGTGDLPNTDPQLGPLAANGGPMWSYAPGAGSPAIDAGDNSGCPAFDVRGYPRPIAAACDIGAVEVGYALWLPYAANNTETEE